MSELPDYPHDDSKRPRHAYIPPETARPTLAGEGHVSPQALERWEVAYAKHGNAFAAYLMLEDTNPEDPNIIESFLTTYSASYPDMRACADSFIEGLGWLSALEEFEREQMDLAGFLIWNYPLMEERIKDIYEAVELGGQVHLFDK
jgi:hypothetical protein